MYAKSIYVQNLSTSALTSTDTTIYTVPNNTRTKWVLAYLTNSTGSTINDVEIDIVNGAAIATLSAKSLTAGESLKLEGGYYMLEPAMEIRARAGATGVSCVITVEETTGMVARS